MKNHYLKFGIFGNKYLIGAFLLGTILQIGVILIPEIATIFKLVPLTSIQWVYTILISLLPIVIIELQKKLNEIKFGKIVYSKQENIKKYQKT